MGEVEDLRKMVESLKRMVTGQGLEETSGETGDREATLKEAEEREKCVGEKTAERSWGHRYRDGGRAWDGRGRNW